MDYNQLTEWMIKARRELHQNPEIAFDERQTADFVARTLRSFGVEVTEGVGGTGVVGTLKLGTSNRSIGLRADMDALRITEANTNAWASRNQGLMHACGHDGHTTMLLGAAHLLAAEGGFDGTVRFIFQPAEEKGVGAQAMLDDDLLSRLPFEEIYGIHNMPGIQVGHVEVRPGAIMAAEDNFKIVLHGKGGHASSPHWGSETLVPACSLVLDLQTIVSRRLNPSHTAVVSVTEFITDGTRNVLPGVTEIRGDVRSFDPNVSEQIENEMHRLASGKAAQYGINMEMHYSRECLPVINDQMLCRDVIAASESVSVHVSGSCAPTTASEDFARFLKHVPGCYFFIGNGNNSAPLHNPSYDFNDAALLHGAQIHREIVRLRLPVTN